MMNFVALYRGPTADEARLIAVSSEPDIVDRFTRSLAGAVDDAGDRDELTERQPLHVVQGDNE